MVFVDLCHQLDYTHPPSTPPTTARCAPFRNRRERKQSSPALLHSSAQRPTTTNSVRWAMDDNEEEERERVLSQSLRLSSPGKVGGGERRRPRGGERWAEQRGTSTEMMMSVQEMAELLRLWLTDKENLKVTLSLSLSLTHTHTHTHTHTCIEGQSYIHAYYSHNNNIIHMYLS